MRNCVFCKLRYKKGSKLSFHKFPTDLTEKNKWLQNMNSFNWIPKERDSLCSKHFDDKCFVKHCSRTALKLGSVPTIFEGVFKFEDQNSYVNLKIIDSKDVSGGKEMGVEEPQPEVLPYPHQLAMSTSPTFKTLDTSSSSSRHQSPKQRGVKRFLSERILQDNGFQKNVCTTDELKRDLQYGTRNDHNYGAFRTPKKSRIEYGVAHDHRYENTSRSSTNTVQRIKRSLKLSNAMVKALKQRVKRLKIKVANLKIVINDLNNRNEECTQLLKQYDGFQMELWKMELKSKIKETTV